VVVSACIDTFGWSRESAGWLGGSAIALAGIPGALSTDWVGFMFALFGQVFLIFGGFMLALLAGYAWSRSAEEELAVGFGFPALRKAWLWLLRTLVPAVLIVVLYFAILQTAVPAAKSLFGAE
jgi:NSS family neurotransmitter:Na+ symporter